MEEIYAERGTIFKVFCIETQLLVPQNKLLSSLQKCSVVEEFIKRMCLHGNQEVPRSIIPRDRSHKSVDNFQ